MKLRRHLPLLSVLALAWLLLRRPTAAAAQDAKNAPPRMGSAHPSELRYTAYMTNFRGPGQPMDFDEWYARNE